MCQAPLQRYRQKIAEPRKGLVAVERERQQKGGEKALSLLDELIVHSFRLFSYSGFIQQTWSEQARESGAVLGADRKAMSK